MKLRVIDFETTDEVQDGRPVGLVEIGYTNVDGATGEVGYPFSAIVDCGLAVTPAARGVHHITDEEIKRDGIKVERAMQLLMEGMEPGDIFVAHNAPFERALFGGGTHAWICTYACARHVWPAAPSHKNQALRYWLELDQELAWPDRAMPPHRAGPDSYVTAHILSRMLLHRHPASLIQLTNTPILLVKVGFGKNAHADWSEMDVGFLRWCLEPARVFRPDQHDAIIHTARHWLNQNTLSGTPFA